MRYSFIDAQKQEYNVVLLCECLQVARSGFYEWQKHNDIGKEANIFLKEKIKAIFKKSRHSYGWRRL